MLRMGFTGTGQGDRRYRYYVCRSRQNPDGRTCPRHYVSAEAIEKSIIEQLQRRHPRDAAMGKLVRAYALEARSPATAQLRLRLVSLIETVAYNGNTGEVTIRMHTPKGKSRVKPKL